MIIIGIATGVLDDAISDDEMLSCVADENAATGTGCIDEKIFNYPRIVFGSISRGHAI